MPGRKPENFELTIIKKGEKLWLAGYVVNAGIPLKPIPRLKSVRLARAIVPLLIIPAIRLIAQVSQMILKSSDKVNKA